MVIILEINLLYTICFQSKKIKSMILINSINTLLKNVLPKNKLNNKNNFLRGYINLNKNINDIFHLF